MTFKKSYTKPNTVALANRLEALIMNLEKMAEPGLEELYEQCSILGGMTMSKNQLLRMENRKVSKKYISMVLNA